MYFCHTAYMGWLLHVQWSAEFQKVGNLGSRIPDIIFEKFGHFWLKPYIGRFWMNNLMLPFKKQTKSLRK